MIYALSKSAIVFIILLESLSSYIHTGNFNDDTFPRPPLHGAYEVTDFVWQQDTIPPLMATTSQWKRFFIHRQGYFIVQNMTDEMQDFQLDPQENHQLILYDDDGVFLTLDYSIDETDVIGLHGTYQGKSPQVKAKKLPLNDLPLMQPRFHWMIDQYHHSAH